MIYNTAANIRCCQRAEAVHVAGNLLICCSFQCSKCYWNVAPALRQRRVMAIQHLVHWFWFCLV